MSIAPPADLDALGALMPFRSISGEQRIEFIRPPVDLDFDRPFFHMTLEDLDKSDKEGALDKISLTLAELRAIVGAHTPKPTGMIFHIGRCGSTLVSRMVGHDPSQLVLREAAPIGGLHRASGGSDRVPTYTIEQAFKDALVAFERFAANRQQRVLVKHSSWESFSMGRVAELLPDVPFVFVYRDPVQTVESSLDGHPGWAPRIHQPRWALQRWVPWLERVDQPFNAATIYASVWAAGAHAALQLPPERVLLIEHSELAAHPERQLALLTAHLGLQIDQDRALGELGQYSKAATDGTAYDPLGSHAHPELSPRTVVQVREVVGDLPDQLSERLARQHANLSDRR